jgi:acyl carrier protein
MTESYIAGEVRRIFEDIFDEPGRIADASISRSSFPEWGSVAHLKLVLAIEGAFGFVFTTEEVAEIDSMSGFVEAIRARCGESSDARSDA